MPSLLRIHIYLSLNTLPIVYYEEVVLTLDHLCSRVRKGSTMVVVFVVCQGNAPSASPSTLFTNYWYWKVILKMFKNHFQWFLLYLNSVQNYTPNNLEGKLLNKVRSGNPCLKWRRGGNALAPYVKNISKYPILAQESIEAGCEKVVAKHHSTTNRPGLTYLSSFSIGSTRPWVCWNYYALSPGEQLGSPSAVWRATPSTSPTPLRSELVKGQLP